jgi:cyclopropane-fatty-acyl-phospholipid synthase
MIEHVGKPHLAEFSGSVARLLKPGGLALLHFISSPKEGPLCSWMDRYIFPGAYLPTLPEMLQHFHNNNLRIIDVENLRTHYQMTLDHWSERFEANKDQITEMHGEEFVRMWRLYLRGCSASFREGVVEIHQVLVSNGNSNALPLTRDSLYR